METTFKVGDHVIYRGDRTTIVAMSTHRLDRYVVEYSGGWKPEDNNSLVVNPEVLDPEKSYNYAAATSLTLDIVINNYPIF